MTHGTTYDEARDGSRLDKQRVVVWGHIKAGGWWTLDELEQATGYPQASISARLRDFRKPVYGGHKIERAYVSRGLWRYRLVRV